MEDTSKVLVLVANETRGTLCAASEGTTRLLRSIDRVIPSNDSNPAPQARHIFACELMMALGRDASLQQYDGVIIYADEAMMEELRRVQTSLVSRLVIAHIVGRPTPASHFPGRPANAEMAYRAVLG
jgi:protein required for attachment to host cells